MNFLERIRYYFFPRKSPDARWEVPCEDMFETLAKEDPQRLVDLLSSTQMGAADLSIAAEIAGREISCAVVLAPLHKLLKHRKPLVREGALLGLAHHTDAYGVLSTIRLVSEEDQCPEVRGVAKDLLRMEGE